MLKKSDFFVSWIIFSIVFYSFLSILIFILLLLFKIPISILLFQLVLSLIIGINIFIFLVGKCSTNTLFKDPFSLQDDTESYQNRIIQFAYSLPLFFSIPFEWTYRIIFQFSFSYGIVVNAIHMYEDWASICENESRFCKTNEIHNAIIIGVYNRFAASALLGCGISKLINSFNENDEKYRVYFFHDKREFFKIINCPITTNLWIFAHGWHGGVRVPYGKCSYSDLVKEMRLDAMNKEAIYQFHCNPGNDPSLVELLSVKRGFVNHRFNTADGIKEVIRIIIEENRMNDLTILN